MQAICASGAEDASDEQIREAAEIAQAIEFIDSKQDGYESAIAQGGSNVSGGQKQRLAIARAIAKNPKIYVFDDSFSALDMKTDAALRRALETKTEHTTVIIVAQRISTILHATRYWYSTMERLSEKARMRNYCTIAKFTSRLPGASCLPKNWDFLRR